MKATAVILILLFLTSCQTQQPIVPDPNARPVTQHSTASIAKIYQRGDQDTITITVELDDPDNSIDQAVVFLNIVEDSQAKNYPQAMQLVLDKDYGSAEPNIFNKVYKGDSLRQGVSTQLSFRIRKDAPPAKYLLALQVFNGTNTNPNNVNINNRLGLDLYSFTIQ